MRGLLGLAGVPNRLSRCPIAAQARNMEIGGSSPTHAFLRPTTPLVGSTPSSCAPLRSVQPPPWSRDIWRIVFRFLIPKLEPDAPAISERIEIGFHEFCCSQLSPKKQSEMADLGTFVQISEPLRRTKIACRRSFTRAISPENKGGYRAWIRTMNNASKGRSSFFISRL